MRHKASSYPVLHWQEISSMIWCHTASSTSLGQGRRRRRREQKLKKRRKRRLLPRSESSDFMLLQWLIPPSNNITLAQQISQAGLESNYYMNQHNEEAATIIAHSNLAVDPITLQQTLVFLQAHFPLLSSDLKQYQVMAATAIVGETIELNDITSTRRAKSGITLERVMRHLGALSREQYLEALAKLTERWRQAPQWLKNKAESLKLAYRVYKKYRAVFDRLSAVRDPNEKSNFTLMAVFWVIFLFLKNQDSEFDNTLASTSLLHAIVVFAFSEIADKFPHHRCSSQFLREFGESRLPQGQTWLRLRYRIVDKLQEVHRYRFQGKPMEVEMLVFNQHYVQRYLDDLSNLYEKFKATLPENTIDELSFLELTKNIAPEAVRHRGNLVQSSACIDRRIDFTQSDDEDEPMDLEQPQQEEKFPTFKSFPRSPEVPHRVPVSPLRLQPVANEPTPVTARHRNLQWVTAITTANYVQAEAQNVQQLYQRYARKDYNAYKSSALLRITNAIVQFTPQCPDVSKRQRFIYHLFEHFINRITENHVQAEMAAILREDTNLNSILCLSCNLFNYAYHSQLAPYRSYCRLFGVTLMEGYKPINWFGKGTSMEENIVKYLYYLEHRILMEELWEDNEGYRLLSDPQELRKYANQALLTRLHRHANERTQELCRNMKASQKIAGKAINLIKIVVEKRPFLLKGHRLDHLIACVIVSFHHNSQPDFIKEMLEKYDTCLRNMNANRFSLFDCEGSQMELITYHSEIFAPCVEELSSSEEYAEELVMPVLMESGRGWQLGAEVAPLRKIRQPPPIITPSLKLPSPLQQEDRNANKYQSRLANTLRRLDMTQLCSDSQGEQPSPTFGRGRPDICRTYSFGDRGDIL